MNSSIYDNHSRLIIKAMNAGTWEWNIKTGELKINKRWAELIGYTLDDFPNPTIEDFNRTTHPDDLSLCYESLNSLFSKEKDYYSLVLRRKHKNGEWITVLDSGQVIKWDEFNKPLIAIGANIDISDRSKLLNKLKNSERNLREIIENTKDIIYRLDINGNFTYLSKAWTTQLGRGVLEVLGNSFVPFVHPDDVDLLVDFFNRIKETTSHQSVYGYRLKHIEGEYKYYESTASAIVEDGIVIGYAGIARDITEVIIRDKEIKYLLYHDQLTDLYNRHYLDNILSQLTHKDKLPICLIVADLNDLKDVNDKFGHRKGDEIIKKAASILKSNASNGYVFRMGGDEFLVILTNTNEDAAKTLINNLNKNVSKIYTPDFPISLSFGYYIQTNLSNDIFNEINIADEYMYYSKQKYRESKISR
ncbi:MAG: sensor domain-containing diguanylate cyclase [Bacilli bacterium]